MPDQQANEMELKRLAMRAKLGIDGDARLSETEQPKQRKQAEPSDLKAEDSKQPEIVQAVADGVEIVEVGPEPTVDPLIIKRRLDGRLKGQPLSKEFKQGLREAYADNLGVDIEGLAKATGISVGVVAGALWEHPKTLAAARQKRAEATLDAMEGALYLMAQHLRNALIAGEVQPNGKNIRDYLVAFGILTDKLALVSGAPTSRHELIVETLDERKARLTAILDKADTAIGLLTKGRKVNGGHSHSPKVKVGKDGSEQ